MSDTVRPSRSRWPSGDSEADREYDELASMHHAVVADLERYRALFEAAPSALLVTDRNLRVLEANRAAAELLDLDKRFLIGKPLAAFVDTVHRREFRTWPTQVHQGRAPDSTHTRMRRRTGVAFDARATMMIGPHELYWAIADETEEMQAESQLRDLKNELEERVATQSAELEALVERLPVGVVVLDATGAISWFNGPAPAILGQEPSPGSALVGWGKRAARGEHVRDVSMAIDTPDGEQRTIELSAVPIPRHGGAALLFTDVTERDRTLRADAEFVENAAHQLRNPISAIVSSIAALDAGARLDETERERFMTHIARESARLEILVEALLTLAGIQQQQQQQQQRQLLALVELVPLRQLLEQLVAATPLREGVRARVSCGARVAVVGDRDLLAQAFGNVIANATQHTERGVVVIRARLDRKTVTVDVTDSGPGVPEDARDRVFDRFFRGSANGGHGSGLGLAIALAAVHAHDARLELLEQREGEGATFRFTIPGARLL